MGCHTRAPEKAAAERLSYIKPEHAVLLRDGLIEHTIHSTGDITIDPWYVVCMRCRVEVATMSLFTFTKRI